MCAPDLSRKGAPATGAREAPPLKGLGTGPTEHVARADSAVEVPQQREQGSVPEPLHSLTQSHSALRSPCRPP